MRDKWAIREDVWTALETARVVRGKSVHDKIPHFIGCGVAASLATELPEWEAARAIKSNPDQAQRPLRQLALEQGKLLYMAVPRLRDERVFIELDPTRPEVEPAKAATISGAFQVGRSVAVNRQGVRVGKGGGYADLEYGLAAAAGVVHPDTPVISTVHAMQVLDEDLPYTQHDVPLAVVITPDAIIRCNAGGAALPRPTGIYWDDLDERKIRSIPLLARLRAEMG
ncbi:5-formyltetrahydrofolate cyclo-ligase-like protein COG0212 [Geodia barretti]|uniref:5-formyltetrahydrofolate cyclo-ligase-like protein COG0212 n=1 Tax=Geodia barretti TaxID=519541 RepID=A0AA35WQI3_GEOBA|nr:5-formyltetrahydrofolate cyclo-ligase-like protein COG0212 [Geodia barretti]